MVCIGGFVYFFIAMPTTPDILVLHAITSLPICFLAVKKWQEPSNYRQNGTTPPSANVKLVSSRIPRDIDPGYNFYVE